MMNKVSAVSLIILCSLALNACGGNTGVNIVPVKMTRVSIDPANLGTRPTTKTQAMVVQEEDITPTTQATTPKTNTTVTPQSNLNTKNTAKTETKEDNISSDDSVPEVTPPPANNESSTQQPEQKKTKVGQLIDKVKNLFKKKS